MSITNELRELMKNKGKLSLEDLMYIHRKTRRQREEIEKLNATLSSHLSTPPTMPPKAEGVNTLKSD